MNKIYKVLIIIILIVAIVFSLKYLFRDKGVAQIEIMEVEEKEEVRLKKEKIVNGKQFVHVSVDDFIGGFEDLTENEDSYNSVFDSPTFKVFKDSHDKYGTVFTLYSFYEKEDFDLKMATDKFAEEFEENSDWLKFGFHALDGSSDYQEQAEGELVEDFNLVTNELLRITGTSNSLDPILRLHYYKGSQKDLTELDKNNSNFSGLLTADDKRVSYFLNEEQTSYLYLHDFIDSQGVEFYKTDIRLENVKEDTEIQSLFEVEDEIIIAFTHEIELTNQEVLNRLDYLSQLSKENNYAFDFLMNRNQ